MHKFRGHISTFFFFVVGISLLVSLVVWVLRETPFGASWGAVWFAFWPKSSPYAFFNALSEFFFFFMPVVPLLVLFMGFFSIAERRVNQLPAG